VRSRLSLLCRSWFSRIRLRDAQEDDDLRLEAETEAEAAEDSLCRELEREEEETPEGD
jgi:hypothetical protein